MKQIFSWTVGSFFRTIGRTIAVLVMGGLLYYILSSNGIGISDLFLEQVKADTQTDAIWATYYSDSSKQNALPSSGNFQYFQPTSSTGSSMSSQLIYFSPTQVKSDYFDYITIPFTITGRQYTSDSNYIDREVICDWDYEEVAGGGYTATSYNCNWYASGTYSAPVPISIQLDISLTSTTNQAQSPCEIQNNKVKCMLLSNVNFDTMIVNYSLTNQNSIQPIRINFSHVIGKYQSAVDRQQQAIEGVQQGIQNQTTQQQQQHQEVMDNNTTQAEDNAEGFFGNFTVPDVGGLSAIVSAPLNTIRSLLSSSCANLVLPLPYVEEDLTLPCMNSIYTEHFGLFFQLYQTIILALISYRCIRSIYFDIHGFTDPTDDRIEVMDL